MNTERNCQFCKYYKDGYCENLELQPCYPSKGCGDFSKREALEQEPRWIPVSEGLPEECKNVIVTDIEVSDTYQSQYMGNGYWECDNGYFRNRIIAWMPLPERYKAESEE